MADPAAARSKNSNPVKALHVAWPRRSQKKQEALDLVPWKAQIAAYIDEIVHRGGCIDIYSSLRMTSCRCMVDLPPEYRHKLADYLVNFALFDKKQQWLVIVEWMKYANANKAPSAHREASMRLYLLPGSEHRICLHACCSVIGYSKQSWRRLMKFYKSGETPVHGLCNRTSNHALDVMDLFHPLTWFFESMKESAAPRATKVVRGFTTDGDTQTELRDTDSELLELPSCTTKRSLHRRYLLEQGWEIKLDSKGRLVERKPVDGKDLDDCGYPISWERFRSFWKEHYPKIVIQKPTEDICNDCFIFANRQKYKISRPSDDSSSEEEEEPVAQKFNDEAEMLAREDIVMQAAHHVLMARKQHELFVRKKAEAKADAEANIVREERRYCFVADFAQNMHIPNLAAEQPGAVYYFSPLNVYPFGIVDGASNPSMLSAHVYYEGQAQKGGNSVVSMLWKELGAKGLLSGGIAKELNFVFDNCAGQNKNRMVLRFLVVLVKLNITKLAKAIFLVKGHTKNDCDRMFNLMKYDYRKRNVYTPAELMIEVNKHDQVTATAMEANEFLDWDTFQTAHMKEAVLQVKKNHIFYVSDGDSNVIHRQEFDGAEEVFQQTIVKEAFRGVDIDWLAKIKELQVIPEPGLQDIKWTELYTKWSKYIPDDRKGNFKYYVEAPPKEVHDNVKKQSKEAKEQRAKRTRTVAQNIANSVVGDAESQSMANSAANPSKSI